MPTVKNVCAHTEDLHDGRALPAYETAEVTDEELELSHYQTRIASGIFLVVDEPVEPKPARRRAKKEDQQ